LDFSTRREPEGYSPDCAELNTEVTHRNSPKTAKVTHHKRQTKCTQKRLAAAEKKTVERKKRERAASAAGS
jgi:hypothetical protein